MGTIQACISHMPIHALEGLMRSLEESVGSLDREQVLRDSIPLHRLSPLGQWSSHSIIKHSGKLRRSWDKEANHARSEEGLTTGAPGSPSYSLTPSQEPNKENTCLTDCSKPPCKASRVTPGSLTLTIEGPGPGTSRESQRHCDTASPVGAPPGSA